VIQRFDAGTFTVGAVRQTMAGLEKSFAGLNGRISQDFRFLIDDTVENGVQKILGPMAAAGFPGLPPVNISQNLINTATRFSAGLVTNVTATQMGRISNILTRSTLAGLSPAEAVKRVGTVLPGQGPFASIASRATTIVRTESLRMYSIVAEQQLQESAKQVPGMRKMWLHTGVGLKQPRVTHMRYSGTVVGVNEFFEVAGHPGERAEKLRFPRDPRGSASNVVNCACTVEEIFPDEDASNIIPPAPEAAAGGAPAAADGGFPLPLPPTNVPVEKQVVKSYDERFEEFAASLTRSEKTAISAWTGSDYMSIRALQLRALEKFKSRVEQWSERQLEKVRAWTKNLETMAKKAPKYTGTLYRGLADLDEETFRKLVEAEIWEMRAFSSTAKNARSALGFTGASRDTRGIILKIKSKEQGIDIERWSAFGARESEVLMEKGEKFRITRVRTVRQVIEDGDAPEGLESWARAGFNSMDRVAVVEVEALK
jgi:hypothetical protein